jgi:hypothetical protein
MRLHDKLWLAQQKNNADAAQTAQRIAGTNTITDSQGVTVVVQPVGWYQPRWPRRRRASKFWPEGIANI